MARPKSIQQSVPGLWKVLRYFWPWIGKERPLIAVSMGALATGVLLRLAEPWPLKFVLDRIIVTDRPADLNAPTGIDALPPMTLLAVCAVAVVVISSLRALADYHQRVGLAKIGNRVLRRIRNQVYLHVQSLSLSFHNTARSGDLIIRVTRDVSLLRDVVSTAALPLVASLITLVGMAVVMALLQWQLALAALATVPLFWLSTIRIGRGIHQAARKQRAREGAMAATAAEAITAIREVQALSLGDAFAEDFSNRNNQSQKEELKAARLSAKLGRTVDILLAIATALVLWYGARLVLRASMTPGDLLVFLTYLRRAFRPAKNFAKHTGRLAKAAAAGERVFGLLEQVPEVRDLPGAAAAPRFEGAVRFDRVSFAYESGVPVLRDIDFDVAPGRFIAITGASGGGKSTLVSLLLRLYDPTQGRVLVDGKDVREYTLASLRSQVSFVLQDTLLFAASIRENIAYGAPDASEEELIRAAEQAAAHEFIMEQPKGYDTEVGERGVTLSVGQRQRIAVARAAVSQSPVLILDEPTTGLDEENQRIVLDALTKLAAGRTTFMITHDLRDAQRADFVVLMDKGRVIESGSHDDLVRAAGRYARLVSLSQ